MKTIYKYVLEIKETQTVSLTRGARILSVANQDGKLCLWVQVETEEENEYWSIAIYGTGNPLPEYPGAFIGTVIIEPYVWHVFIHLDGRERK